MIQDLIIILIIVVALGAGAASVLLTNRLFKKYETDYLNSYQYYLILLFIFGIYGILGTFVVRTLLSDIKDAPQFMDMILNFLPFLGVPFLLTGWYMFIKMSLELVNLKLFRSFTWVYFVLLVLFFLSYGLLVLNITDLDQNDQSYLTKLIKIIFLIIDGITLIIALINIYFRNKKVSNQGFTRAMIAFGHINLIVRVTAGVLFYFSDRSIVLAMIYLLVFFAGNLIPVSYFTIALNRYLAPVKSQANLETDLFTKLENYNISHREYEVIEKICDGLSNQQISDALFISLQTVKDHSHNIYKKLGVKNRVSLVNMMQNL